jgi:ssDNA-binding Zn-finger/Zn-ribbon topoisomerase 1
MSYELPSQTDWEKNRPKSEMTDELCPECKKPLRLMSGQGGREDWYGCSGYPQCKYTKQFLGVLPVDDYIGRIVKFTTDIEQQTYNSWKQRGRVKDLTLLPKEEREFCHNTEILLYCLKSSDPLKDVNGNIVPPLFRRVWRKIIPSLGFKNDNSPSIFRAFLAFATNQDVSANIKGEGTIEEDVLGKYIGLSLAINKKQTQNTVTCFSKLPDSFKPDSKIEEEGMKKYYEGQQKAQERATIQASTGVSEKEVEQVVDSVDLGQEVKPSDLPF